MAKNLTPIGEFPIAEMLPDYLDAARIGVNTVLLNKIAHLGHFQPDITLAGHIGKGSHDEVGIAGFESYGLASASMAVTAHVAPLSRYELGPSQADENLISIGRGHDRIPLKLSVNMAAIHERLASRKESSWSIKAWARQLNVSVGQGLRAAALEHLVLGQSSSIEFGAYSLFAALSLGMSSTVFLQRHEPISFAVGVALPLACADLVHLGLKTFIRRGCRHEPWSDICFSLFPGFHIDRYAAVWGLTKMRRIIKPID